MIKKITHLLMVGIVVGSSSLTVSFAGSIEFQNWTTTVVYNPPLPPPNPNATDGGQGACSGFSICTNTQTPVCPACSVWEWLDWLCDCPTAYTTQQTFSFAWTDTSYSTTTTGTAGGQTHGNWEAISVAANANGSFTTTWTVHQGYCSLKQVN